MNQKRTPAKRQSKKSDARGGQVVHKQTSKVIATWEGPMPPPAVLSAYDELVPGTAQRIIEMSEREQLHRHKNEDDAVDAQTYSVKLVATADFIARLFGVLFLMIDFAATLYVGAYQGNVKLAAILFSPFVIIALIKAFSGSQKK